VPGQIILKKLEDALQSLPEIRLAWVYGSFASNTARAESDIDVAVAAATPLSPDRRVEIGTHLSLATAREIDLVDLTQERGIIVSQVLTRGRLLINRDPILLAHLIKRMWLDRADFWPLRERAFSARRKKAFEP